MSHKKVQINDEKLLGMLDESDNEKSSNELETNSYEDD